MLAPKGASFFMPYCVASLLVRALGYEKLNAAQQQHFLDLDYGA
jgi:hypothetical protein